MMCISYFIMWFAVVHQSYSMVFNDTDKFLYFGYGSNLLERRIHLNNPTARFFSTAKLPGYRLDFETYIESWNGAAATIAADPDSYVLGALWTLNISDMKNLDTQEGVDLGLYYAMNVSVVARDGLVYNARTYRQTIDPPKVPSSELPPNRQPSDTYMQVIILGAVQCSLSTEYINYLLSFSTNGKLASWPMRQNLGYPFNITHNNYSGKNYIYL